MRQRRVAALIPVDRPTLRHEHHRSPQGALRVGLRELAGSRVRYGYRGLTVMLKREGWEVNAKRIYRLYIEEGSSCESSVARREHNGSARPKDRQCAETTGGAWASWLRDVAN